MHRNHRSTLLAICSPNARRAHPLRLVIWCAALILLGWVLNRAAVHAQTPIPAAPAVTPAAPQTVEELQLHLQRVLTETRTPGLGVALVLPDGQVTAFGLGVADVAAQTPVTVDTRFRLGSVSKSFVGLAVLKLQEEGKLDLDAVVTDLAPEIEFDNPWAATAPVRVVHLLEHTAGLNDMLPREYAASDPDITTLDAIQVLGKPRPVRWPPGRYMSYSNPGPVIAAYLVEKASGQRYEEYIQTTVFDPLGMSTAGFFLTPEVEAALAKSYAGDGVTPIPYSHILLRPSGAASATLADLARLVQMLLGRGTLEGVQILTPESIGRMETPVSSLAAQAGVTLGYGLGNFTTVDHGFVFHGHDGGIDGFATSYGYLPDAGVGYAFSINSANGIALQEIGALVRSFLVRDLEAPAPPPTDAAVDVAAVAGNYAPLTERIDLLFFLTRLTAVLSAQPGSDGLLVRPISGGAPVTLLPLSPTLYRANNTPAAGVAFVEVEGDTVMTGELRHARRIPAWQGWLRFGGLLATQLTLLSSLLLVVIWLPLAYFRRQRRGTTYALYLLPALAVTCIPVALFLLLRAPDAYATLGTFNWRSLAAWLLLWAFFFLGLAALAMVIRLRATPPNLAGWIHAGLVAVAALVTAGYLMRWGIIGLPPWLW